MTSEYYRNGGLHPRRISRRRFIKLVAAMTGLLAGCSPTRQPTATPVLRPALSTVEGGAEGPASAPTDMPSLVPSPTSTAVATPVLNAVEGPTSTPTSEATLALVNGTLIDGTGAEPIVDAVLVIQEARIVAVGPHADVAIPHDAQIIDVQGATILPGFINAHVHLAFETENLAAWAQAGVTTVRDVGASTLSPLIWDEWIQAIYEGNDLPRSKLFDDRDTTLNLPQYARIVAAGPIVTVPGGYPIPIHGNNLALSVTSPEDTLQKTSKLLDAGADVIKIALESRWGLQQARLSKEEVEAIVAVAHERATIVTAHVGLAQDLQLGVEAGIDDAAHMVNDHLPDGLIAQMISRDVYIVPTLAVKEAYGWPGATAENVRRFVMAGGKVALGDDYGNPGIELGMPIRDMELMKEAGMTPMQIIVAGTRNAAHVCNLEHELGTLEVGKIADVLVVDGNPLEDVHALTNVRLVLHNGVVIRE